MKYLKTAVVGTGHLGKLHAEKYSLLPQSKLTAVCDADLETGTQIAEKYSCQFFTSFRDLPPVDAVSVATPTASHYEIAKFFLLQGTHVLIEKPMTSTLVQAEELIRIANQKNLVLQVGHLERFNPAILLLNELLNEPKFIESHRLAPYKPRGTDVNVILDLMIHDLELIQHISQSKIKSIHASGLCVLSQSEDIASARVEFENQCVANLTASRVSFKSERKMRVFQKDSYISLDLQNKTLTLSKKGDKEMFPGITEIKRETKTFEENDSLKGEIDSFLNSIIENKPAKVTGEDGRNALATALHITELVSKSYNNQ